MNITKFLTFCTCYCFEKAQKHANSTFTKDQEIFIIVQFSIFMSQSAVKRQNISIIVEIWMKYEIMNVYRQYIDHEIKSNFLHFSTKLFYKSPEGPMLWFFKKIVKES